MDDERVEAGPPPARATSDAAFHLRLGSGTVDVPSGRIVALIGENGSGAADLLRAVVDRIVREEQGSRAARRRARAERAAARLRDTSGTVESRRPSVVSASGVRASGALLDDSRIAVVTRRSGLSPTFDVSENIFLGDVLRRSLGPIPVGIDWAATRARSAVLLDRVGSRLSPTSSARELGELDRLVVELARALQRDVGLLVVDEPTALLDADEVGAVVRAMDVLRDEGTAVLVLTQKPLEALGYADSVVVARDGEPVAVHHRDQWQATGADAVRREILRAMVDRPGSASGGDRDTASGTSRSSVSELLRIEGWSTHDALHPWRLAVDGADLGVAEGEVVGIAGLDRSGAETLLLSVYGRSAGSDSAGTVRVRGAQVDTSTVEKSIAAGLFFAATETPRYRMRLLGGISVPVAPGRLSGLARSGLIDVEEAPSDGFGGRILGAVRSVGREGEVSARIRGLVQAFATSEREVLLLSEPLRGSSGPERAALQADLERATAAGKGVVIVSADLESLRRLCDRIVVMAGGRVTGSVAADTPAVEIAPLLAPH